MDIIRFCSEYCVGCGICKSERNIEMMENKKGYLHPVFQGNEDVFLQSVCPIMESYSDGEREDLVWGKIKGAFAAHAADAKIRKTASSGGVLTALALFLLETKKVDGILQVCVDPEHPTETICRVSRTREQILECCGSRYSISSPWLNLSDQIEEGMRYAAIGKPCDIMALRRLKENEKLYDEILYLLSFFCAGLPSKDANQQLLMQLDCKMEDCASLCYRGNGWPGYATAIDRDGGIHTMEYSKAWGGILGRDVHPYCRLCFDGIGEAADIVCGDGWYIKDGEPDFSEGEGRNIVFARNMSGLKLMQEAETAGYLQMEKWQALSDLQIIQKYQYTRKTTMRAKLLGYRICGRTVPFYSRSLLRKLSKQANGKQKMKIFLGTVRRIVQKKI